MPDDGTEYTDPDGVVRRLGNLPRAKEPAKMSGVYGTTPQTPVFGRRDWRGFIDILGGTGPESFTLPPTHHQQSTNMCNASATAGAMEAQRTKQGMAFKSLSAGDLYRRISGGVDGGSYLEDGLRVAMREGVASADVVPYLDWQRDYRRAAEEDRRNYRVTKAYLCPTFDHCISAVIQGYDLISGVRWFRNYTPGEDGWLPAPQGGSVGGHAVHGYKATYRKVGNRYVYGIWHQNSWGSTWGLGGRGVLPESVYDGWVGGWWAVVQVVQTEE